jgi:hypothetical protein
MVILTFFSLFYLIRPAAEMVHNKMVATLEGAEDRVSAINTENDLSKEGIIGNDRVTCKGKETYHM